MKIVFVENSQSNQLSSSSLTLRQTQQNFNIFLVVSSGRYCVTGAGFSFVFLPEPSSGVAYGSLLGCSGPKMRGIPNATRNMGSQMMLTREILN